MARILYWNVNNFSLPKIQAVAPIPAYGPNQAADRLNYMVQGIMRGPVGGPIPDIIVIVEVYSRVRELGSEGTVLKSTSNAGQGLLTLLAQIRADAVLGVGTNWCLVPPINVGLLGQREAVAVFYNATNLQFTGPNLLYQLYGPPPPGTNIGQSQPVNAATHAAITNYNPGWAAALPALGRTTNFPVGGGTVAIPENQLAGEWQYYAAGAPRPIPSPAPPAVPPNRIQFPNLGCRGPFQTRFLEIATNKTINLFSIHTSPATAKQAVRQMQQVPEMTAVAAGEVNVVLGDFNVDTFNAFGTPGNAYNWMLAPGGIYTCQLDPRIGHAGAVVPARKPYTMTHLLPPNDAKPFNNLGVVTDPQHNVYPRYGYMGSSWPAINDSGSIDNVFTAYGAGAAPPGASNITVVNTLTGTPYNFIAPAPAGVTAELTGGLNYPSHLPMGWLTNGLNTNPVLGGIDPLGPWALAYPGIFTVWGNYGKVYSTSDHLPLMVDV